MLNFELFQTRPITVAFTPHITLFFSIICDWSGFKAQKVKYKRNKK